MNDHTFCKIELAQARKDARLEGVTVPKGLYTMRSGKQVQVLTLNQQDEWPWFKACCGNLAKAKYIEQLIALKIELRMEN